MCSTPSKPFADFTGTWNTPASPPAAGAMVMPDTLWRGRGVGVDARTKLADHDAWGYFDPTMDLVTTGPTRTNVNDYRVVLVP